MDKPKEEKKIVFYSVSTPCLHSVLSKPRTSNFRQKYRRLCLRKSFPSLKRSWTLETVEAKRCCWKLKIASCNTCNFPPGGRAQLCELEFILYSSDLLGIRWPQEGGKKTAAPAEPGRNPGLLSGMDQGHAGLLRLRHSSLSKNTYMREVRKSFLHTSPPASFLRCPWNGITHPRPPHFLSLDPQHGSCWQGRALWCFLHPAANDRLRRDSPKSLS